MMADEHTEADLRKQVIALREALERAHAAQGAAVEAATRGLAEENRQLRQTAVALREAMEQAAAKHAERARETERAFHDERAQLPATVRAQGKARPAAARKPGRPPPARRLRQVELLLDITSKMAAKESLDDV